MLRNGEDHVGIRAMKLGVNAWRIRGRTGVPRYVSNVVRGWTSALVGTRFDAIELYTPEPLDREALGLPSNLSVRVLRPNMRQLIWENTRLGPVCDADVLWCPAYSRPILTRARTVVTTHDATWKMFPHLYPFATRTFYAALYGWSARHATLVITNNETTRSDIIRCFGVDPGRIRVVPLAAAEIFRPIRDDHKLADVRAKYVGADVPFFLSVGKLSPRRNVPKIIEGFAQFKKTTGLPHRLLVIGENSLGLPFDEVAASFGVRNECIHPDFVPDQDLTLLYNAAEAFILAATYEANSFTSLEAQATGTPVIVPDTPGMCEMTGRIALILPVVDPATIAAAMERMARDPSLRGDLSARGLEHAARFTWPRTSAALLAVLEEAAALPPHEAVERMQ